MPYYTRPKHVVHFSYRDFEVDVLKAFRGAKHCELEHKPRERVCEACGERIFPMLVYLIEIDGTNPGIDCESEEEAAEFARAIIDDELERRDGDGIGDEDDEDEDDEDEPLTESNEKGSDKGLMLPPPPPGDRPAGNTPATVLHQMKKLGWVQRAIAIINAKPKT